MVFTLGVFFFRVCIMVPYMFDYVGIFTMSTSGQLRYQGMIQQTHCLGSIFFTSPHFHTPVSWGPGLVLVIDHCITCLQKFLSALRLFVALFVAYYAVYSIGITMPWLLDLGLCAFLTLWFPMACVTELPKSSIVGVAHWSTF